MNVYLVTYDLRFGRAWAAAGNANGWASRHVVAEHDAREACAALERAELKTTYGDRKQRPEAVRIISVTLVASNALVVRRAR